MTTAGERGPRTRFDRRDAAIALGLLALCFAVYGRCLGDEFLATWDDAIYVTGNRALLGSGREAYLAAFTGYHAGNWAPLPILSYMLDHAVWGMNPAGFVATNLLLHAGNAILLHLLGLRLAARRLWPAIAAVLFLVHPVQVETVAWISQRKTLLAMAFTLLALHAWLAARRRRGGRDPRGLAAALACFALALAAKSVAVVVPGILVLLDRCWFPGRPLRRTLADLVPFGGAALAIGALALHSQSPDYAGGRVPGFHGGSPFATACTMLTILARYLGMLLWPAHLSAWYHPAVHAGVDGAVAASAVLATALLALGEYLRRRRRKLLFWYATFFLGLLPVSQVVPLLTLMNDRYLYFPMLGAAGFAAAALLGGNADREILAGPAGRRALAVAAVAGTALAVAAHARTAAWHDGVALWTDAAEKEPCGYAQDKLGLTLLSLGRIDEAIAACSRAREVEPGYVEALNCLGVAHARRGDLDSAGRMFATLLEARPADVAARRNLERVEALRAGHPATTGNPGGGGAR